MATVTANQVQALYIGYLGRAADKDGLDFWTNAISTNVSTIDSVALGFTLSQEYQSLYSGLTTSQLVSAVYQNVLGRTADAEGLEFWVSEVNKGAATADTLVLKMINSLGAVDQLTLDNRVTSGNAYTASAAANGNYNTTDAAAAVGIAPQGLVTLTNGTDTVVGNIFEAGLVYTPGGNDRINSLQDEDSLTGSGTNPTLNATLGNANDNGATIITPELKGIETVNVAFTGSGAAVTDLDLQDATGLQEVNITRISQASNVGRVENVKQVLDTLSIANSNANNAGVAEFSFGNGVLAGSNTTSLTLDNVQLGTVNIGQNTSGVGASGVGIQGYENITIESTGVSNSVGVLNLPMDTGTAGKITITGDQDLTLGAAIPVINGATTTTESTRYAGGIAQANGRLSAIDASALTGDLTLNIGAGLLSTGKADTSGVVQNVTITGGSGNDKFILQDVVQAGDSLTGGTGTDTLIVTSTGTVNSVSSVITGIENLEVRAAAGGAVTVDVSKLVDTTSLLVRNEGAVGAANPDAPTARALVTNLNNVTAAQANAVNTQHSNTGSNGITQNTINVNLATATGATDSVTLNINEGLNTDPRFNLLLATQTAPFTGGVESVTLSDNDTESNTVGLVSVGQHTGTVTLKGGVAGTFLNLDTTTAGANGGVYQYDVTGAADLNSSDAGATVGRIADLSNTAGQVKLVAGTVDASAELSNVIARVSTSPASVSAVGAQTITLGAGNDTVIFDNLNDTRAGLTISDTVTGGAGTDTLAIDGGNTAANPAIAITLGASEWTNVSGFENIRLIGGATSYNLTLTDSLLSANSDSNGYLNVINDNDLFNNTGRTVAQAAVSSVTNADGTIVAVANDGAAVSAAESAAVLDVRTLSAGSKWSYKGDEGVSRTADRIIMSDANIDGNAKIDGGAIDNITNNSGIASLNGTTIVGNGVAANTGNADVIEVRNSAVVSQGDLANVKNIGTLSFTNDLAITQVSTLQLNDTIVDSMVDSYQASVSRAAAATSTAGGANVEVLQINAVDNVNVDAATTGLTIEAGSLTDKSDLSITLGRGINTVTTGAGQDSVVLLGNYVEGTYVGAAANGVNIDAQSTSTVAEAAITPVVARVLAATEVLNLGSGIDTLTTYGAINLAAATVSNIENLVANSDVTLTASQLASFTSSFTFEGATNHTLTIVNDGAAPVTIDLAKLDLLGTGDLTITTTGANAAGVTYINSATVAGEVGTGNITLDGTVLKGPLDTTAPEVTAGQALSYAENSAEGTVLGTVAATDDVAVTGYSIATGNDDGFFAIDANTGVITLTAAGAAVGAASNDFETAPNIFTLGVTASDGAGNVSAVADVALTVTDVIEGTGTVLPTGAVSTVAATDGADVFSFSVGDAAATIENTQLTITGFNTAADSLNLDLPTALAAGTTLDQLNGVEGVVVQSNPIAGETVITFGADANGDVISLTLVGVADPAQVNVTVV